MIDAAAFWTILDRVEKAGHADDVKWAETIKPPRSARFFALEIIYVICNSGMRFTVAREIYYRVVQALHAGRSARTGLGHLGKAAAIDRIWRDRTKLFREYRAAPDKVEWLGALPWIGPITKFHCAKNFGVDCVKPDVHIARLAKLHDKTPDALCRDIAKVTGHRVATVDTVLWRACAIGIVNSKTGEIRRAA